MTNPLLDTSELPRFDDLKSDHAEPALRKLIAEHRQKLAALLENPDADDFDSLVIPLEDMGHQLSRVWSPVGHLQSVLGDAGWRSAYNSCLPLMTEHITEKSQNDKLHQAYERISATLPTVATHLTASLLVGAAVAVFCWWLFAVLKSEDLQQGAEWRYDVSRINELRRADVVYRVFQPAIAILAVPNRIVFRDSLPRIRREIQASGLTRFWLPEEYLARAELIALFMSPVYVYVFFSMSGPPGLLLAAMAVVFTAWYLRRSLAVRARVRLRTIKRRLPFLLRPQSETAVP